jgi:hypothetical protein
MIETGSRPESSWQRLIPTIRLLIALTVRPLLIATAGFISIRIYEFASYLHILKGGVPAFIVLFLIQFSIYLVACYLVLSRKKPAGGLAKISNVLVVAVVLIFSVFFRSELVDEPPYLSSDVYRYVWDGRVQSEGINPYRYIPSDENLSHLRDQAIYGFINRRDFAQTIYPPAAQMIFLALYTLSPSDVHSFKVGMSWFDGATMVAILLSLLRLGLEPSRIVIFAWHPLVIWEGAHSGHIESAWIAFLALAILARTYNRPVLIGIALAVATLIKFYPVLMLPAFIYSQHYSIDGAGLPRGLSQFARRALEVVSSSATRRVMLAFGGTVVLAYLPYVGAGSLIFGYLPGYLKEEGFVHSGSRYFLLELARNVVNVPSIVYSAVAALILFGFGLWTIIRSRQRAEDTIKYALGMIGAFLILSSPRFSWYFAGLIPFLCFIPRTSWFYLSGACVFLYLLWLTSDYPGIPVWLGVALYGPTAAFLFWEYLRRRTGRIERVNVVE